jgi:hypothetical protein
MLRKFESMVYLYGKGLKISFYFEESKKEFEVCLKLRSRFENEGNVDLENIYLNKFLGFIYLELGEYEKAC